MCCVTACLKCDPLLCANQAKGKWVRGGGGTEKIQTTLSSFGAVGWITYIIHNNGNLARIEMRFPLLVCALLFKELSLVNSGHAMCQMSPLTMWPCCLVIIMWTKLGWGCSDHVIKLILAWYCLRVWIIHRLCKGGRWKRKAALRRPLAASLFRRADNMEARHWPNWVSRQNRAVVVKLVQPV